LPSIVYLPESLHVLSLVSPHQYCHHQNVLSVNFAHFSNHHWHFSSWFYQNKLYSFGGLIPPYDLITNEIYTIDLSGGPPYEFTYASPLYSLVNMNTLEARHGHDCKLVTSMKYDSIRWTAGTGATEMDVQW
jgi:hypothetical protein